MFLFDQRIYHASFTVHFPQLQQVIYISLLSYLFFLLIFLKNGKESWYFFSAIAQWRKVLPASHLACSAQNIVQSPSGLGAMHIFDIWLLGFGNECTHISLLNST